MSTIIWEQTTNQRNFRRVRQPPLAAAQRYTSSQWCYGATQQIWRTYQAIDVRTPAHPQRRMINDKVYHHMCSFFSTQIFSHPCLKDLTYYMRVDTDSLFTAPFCYNPIKVIHHRQRLYGYVFIGSEPQWVTSGMWSLVQNYPNAHPSVDKQLMWK